jgi:polyisoprenoid-binding protein YceI
MKNRVAILSSLTIMLLLTTACGLLREPEAASAPIEAVPLETDQSEGANSGESGTDLADSSASGRVFRISPAASEVRFELDEDLRGQRNTVVGTTNQIAGELSLDLSQPLAVQVGTIRVNARTLETDNGFRNRAIQNRILQTGLFEFIDFTPTSIEGLPDRVESGDSVSFTMSGDLTLRDISRPVVFEVDVTLVSEDQLTGSAAAIVMREDFDLQIPSVPNVANVEDEVELYIEFVANTG